MTPALTIAIAVPLEADLVEQIRAVDPSLRVLYEPELLPPERYPSDHAGDPDFVRGPAAEARYWELVNQADILYGFPQESPAGLARAVAENPKLVWVQAMAAGAGGAVKAAGVAAADLDRITITTSAGVHAVPLAEFAMMGVLNGLKRTAELAAEQSARRWPQLRVPMKLAQGSRLVITGLGEIGVETARLAAVLGMRVTGTKRTVEPVPGVGRVGTNEDLAALLADADAVVNTLPGTAYTDKLFTDAIFDAMALGTIVVNVGRGTVIDEGALLRALENGQVSYACLDVFAVEPLPQDSALWTHPRVLVSPHTAALNAAENQLITERFCANLANFMAGEPMPHTVDPIHYY